MVELAIALTLLMAIVYPFFYYGVFFTDLAAWKATLYINARDEAVGVKGNYITFGRYIFLLNSRHKRSTYGKKAIAEGEAKVINIGKLPLISTIKIPAKHEKFKEDPTSYNPRNFFEIVKDFAEGMWDLLVNLVSSLSELLSSL